MAFLKRLNPHFRSKSSASGDGSSLTPVAEMAPPSDLPLTSDSAEEYATDDPDNDGVHSGDVDIGDAQTEKQCEGEQPLVHSNAKARVDAMREALLPQPAVKMVEAVSVRPWEHSDGHAESQSVTFPPEEDISAKTGLAALQADILWASVLPFRDATGLATCHTCGSDFSFPKEFGWKLHSCGHYYHVSCFKDFVLAARMKNQEALQQACVFCETLHRQLTAFEMDELRARIQRLERHLLYYRVDCYGAGEATKLAETYCERPIDAEDDASHLDRPSSKTQAALSSRRADVEDRKQRYERAAQVQKQSWRKSVPVGVNIGALEKAWKLNSNHPIFDRLSKLDENEVLECLNELAIKQKESNGNEKDAPHDNLEDDTLDSGVFLGD